jgi:hypothetical protein
MSDRLQKVLGGAECGKIVFFVVGEASALSLLRSVVGYFEGMSYAPTFGSHDVYLVLSDRVQGFRYIVQFCGCAVLVFSESGRFSS